MTHYCQEAHKKKFYRSRKNYLDVALSEDEIQISRGIHRLRNIGKTASELGNVPKAEEISLNSTYPLQKLVEKL